MYRLKKHMLRVSFNWKSSGLFLPKDTSHWHGFQFYLDVLWRPPLIYNDWYSTNSPSSSLTPRWPRAAKSRRARPVTQPETDSCAFAYCAARAWEGSVSRTWCEYRGIWGFVRRCSGRWYCGSRSCLARETWNRQKLILYLEYIFQLYIINKWSFYYLKSSG